MILMSATKDCIWLRELLIFFKIGPTEATTTYVDNQGAEGLAVNPTFHQRSKHIRTKYHRIR
jgi:hypothetical protein